MLTLPAPPARRAVILICALTTSGCGALLRSETAPAAPLIDLPEAPPPLLIPDEPELAWWLAETERRAPGLRQRSFELAAAEAREDAVTWLPDPQVRFGTFLEPVETRTGPQRRRWGVTQRLPWYGRFAAALDAARAQSQGRLAAQAAARAELRREVRELIAELRHLRRALDITRSTAQLLEGFEAVVLSRFRTGQGRQSSVLRIQTERARIENRIADLEERRPALNGRLNALLDRDVGAPLPWPAPETDDEDVGQPPALSADAAPLDANPELSALAARALELEARRDEAGAARVPSLAVSLDVIETDGARQRGVRGSGDDPVILGFGVELPLWFGRLNAQLEAAELELKAVGMARRRLLRELESRAAELLVLLREALRERALLEASLLPRAEQTESAVLSGYQAGVEDFGDLLAATRERLEMRLALSRTRADATILRARIARLAGDDTDTEED